MSTPLRKPRRLSPGDTVAVVSLSSGILGEPDLIHKYHLAKARLEGDFGLKVRPMPHALLGTAYVHDHPRERAEDLMEAFRDPTVSAVFCAIGGDDSVRLLPYVDLSVLRANPKIFMGYSDTTVGHFMMYQAGLVSFYGPSIMCEFGEYGGIFPYTERSVRDLLFAAPERYPIPSAPEWTDEHIPWRPENQNQRYTMRPEEHGYEVLCGSGAARGHLLGGCLDVFMMVNGTSVWPTLDQWRGALLFLETSEEKPSPDLVTYALRNLAAQGVLSAVNGILWGKPQDETYYEEYKQAIHRVVVEEEGLDLPVLYNVNIGHARPIGVLPMGIQAEIDCDARSLTLLESPVL